MKRKTLALILAAALTVTSVEGTAVMASAAEFTSEAVEETEAELETAPEDSADVAVLSDQGDSSELNEIEISDSEEGLRAFLKLFVELFGFHCRKLRILAE